jgi:hypothetical protein
MYTHLISIKRRKRLNVWEMDCPSDWDSCNGVTVSGWHYLTNHKINKFFFPLFYFFFSFYTYAHMHYSVTLLLHFIQQNTKSTTKFIHLPLFLMHLFNSIQFHTAYSRQCLDFIGKFIKLYKNSINFNYFRK